MRGSYSARRTEAESPVAEFSKKSISHDNPTVGVVITTFNHARFLADAISSVLSQTRPADEIVVVDDGSTNNPAGVVANFAGVRVIRQENRGLAAARNTGLRGCTTSHIVFLDADDRLLPEALEKGLTCAGMHPACAFVYGGHRYISEDGRSHGEEHFNEIEGDAFIALLRGNLIGMHATVLYRCDCLNEVNGFDESLRRCEDYDLYLRFAQRYSIGSHPGIVAEYRWHGQNMSADFRQMLRAVIMVLNRHGPYATANPSAAAALRDGKVNWRTYYALEMLEEAGARWRARQAMGAIVKDLVQATWWSPRPVVARLQKKVLPPVVVGCVQRLRGRPEFFPLGSVRFGDRSRASQISRKCHNERLRSDQCSGSRAIDSKEIGGHETQ
jgi:glycosyltransferase involved in cell wall biosynthesis